MKTLLLIPVVSMAAYLIWFRLKYHMTESISKTYKYLQAWEKPFFTLNLVFVAIPIMYVGIESTQSGLAKGLFFLAGSLIVLVGASPAFWESKMENTAHLIGSYGGIGIGAIACFVAGFPVLKLLPVIAFALFTVAQFFIKKWRVANYIYWIEAAAFAGVVLCLVN